ncbi:glycosyltransferase [Pseudotabrizicola sp. 4114]|uniref:glycosyltransferase family 4 protein n=1 Tax=Pseudotabrizicola sp. 4114 TaxID=2817731 RepID=UPI0028659288|nr:glycosyltransferase involved in cell wall biosynthesis [Pseudorhodobacter sp. 4114]
MTQVLLIHERFAPDSGGGGEYVALERARWLMRSGCQVRVLCAGDPSITEVDGIPTCRFAVPRQAMLLLLPQAVAEARRADIVHAFTFHAAPLAYAAARLARRPVVCEQLGLFGPAWRDMRAGLAGRVLEQVERWQLRLRFDDHLFLSPASFDLARRLGFGGTGSIVTPGIDASSAVAGDKPAAAPVLFAGKLDRRKGFDRLCAVAESMPDIRFEAVGWTDGTLPCAPGNVAIIEGRGAVYHAALARASVLFMPSRAETFGLVIFEAMQAGCSIVSTIPADYHGVLLDPWDHDAAVRAIRARTDDPGLALTEGHRNRTKAKSLSWQASSDAVLAIYRKLLSEPKFKGSANEPQ